MQVPYEHDVATSRAEVAAVSRGALPADGKRPGLRIKSKAKLEKRYAIWLQFQEYQARNHRR